MYLEIFSRETQIRHQFGKVYLKKSRKLSSKRSILKKFWEKISLHSLFIRKKSEMQPNSRWHFMAFRGLRSFYNIRIENCLNYNTIGFSAFRRLQEGFITTFICKKKNAKISGFWRFQRVKPQPIGLIFQVVFFLKLSSDTLDYNPQNHSAVKKELKSEDPRVVPYYTVQVIFEKILLYLKAPFLKHF